MQIRVAKESSGGLSYMNKIDFKSRTFRTLRILYNDNIG